MQADPDALDAKPTVLIIDDEAALRRTLSLVLSDDFTTIEASGAREGLKLLESAGADIVLLDVMLPGMDGISAIERIRAASPGVPVVMLSAFNSAEKAVAALKTGAVDYITKPFDNDRLVATLKRYASMHPSRARIANGHAACECGLVGSSDEMKRVRSLIRSVASVPSNVLITGESGTGKELVARAIHDYGPRRGGPFVAVNCGAVPADLLESELFGHEKGAFTGAVAARVGKFEHADGGTLFLDEIGAMRMDLQVKLLRALQDRTIERIGSNAPVKVDIRVVAATNSNLAEAVRKGAFREDLYYRLNVVPVALPPLRDRKGDAAVLAWHFLDRLSKKHSKRIEGVSQEVLDVFGRYRWPGNVRELENLMERIVVMAREGELITADLLPQSIREGASDAVEGELHGARMEFERACITNALEKAGWNRNEAAGLLGIHRNTLRMKMKALGIGEKPPAQHRRP